MTTEKVITLPTGIDKILEFDKVREIIAGYCAGEPGVRNIEQLQFSSDEKFIARSLNLIAEWALLSRLYSDCRIHPYEDISSLKKIIHIEGYVYDVEHFLLVKTALEFAGRMTSLLGKIEEPEEFPETIGILQQLETKPDLLNRLSRTFDAEGNVLPEASDNLIKLHRYFRSKQREADQKFASMVRTFSKNGWLTDNKETMRNGRRVLSVPSEHKRKIKGIIHDESSSGKTTFIEPEEVITSNNDLFDARQAIRKEEYQILSELSGSVRGEFPAIEHAHLTMVEFDAIRAKTLFSLDINAVAPEIHPGEPRIELKQARHPLLVLKFREEEREVVPFDLTLDPSNHILVVSGPNAGGKSVLLKSVGIIQLMFQAGLPVPAEDGTKLGVFSGIFADMGDQQSLEDDLSTYSSHLTNMKSFLANANPQSLLLIDEFGSGTDPKIGGALAEAMIRRFRYLKTFGVFTTHYGNLKIYANNASGLINGAMTFDKKDMSPTYEFSTGKPGSSFGFEIAKKVGIHSSLLKYARNRAGSGVQAVDEMLADLQKEKAELAEAMRKLKSREEELQRLTRNFDHLHREMEVRRKKMKLQKKQIESAAQTKLQRELEDLVRDARKENDLKKKEQILRKFKEKSRKMVSEQEKIKEELHKEEFGGKVEWREGMHAKLRSGSEVGQLMNLSGRKAMLLFESGLKMQVALRDLVPASDPIKRRKERSVKTEISYNGTGFNNKIDIRGLRYREALEILNEYIEKALLSSQNQVVITHGKGEGALKKAVIETLDNFPPGIERSHPPDEQGGDGVTVLRFL